MRNAIGAFLLSAAAIAAAWWWLGRPIALSSTPLAPGEKLECVSYAPYRDNETPINLSTRIEPWRIEEDLRQLLPSLHASLAEGGAGRTRVEMIAGE